MSARCQNHISGLPERTTARRAELNELEEQLAERDELAVAVRVLERMTGQLADARASAWPMPGQVGGRAVMLVPHSELADFPRRRLNRRHSHPHPAPHRKADRHDYSGKHRSHGLRFLALTDENGRLNGGSLRGGRHSREQGKRCRPAGRGLPGSSPNERAAEAGEAIHAALPMPFPPRGIGRRVRR